MSKPILLFSSGERFEITSMISSSNINSSRNGTTSMGTGVDLAVVGATVG